MTKLVVIGNSPLAFLLARQLDQDLARTAHTEVTLIVREDQAIYWPALKSLFGTLSVFALVPLLENVVLKKATVKRINLSDQRVVTSNGVINYDYLVIDQTPVFLPSEVKVVAAGCQRLVNEVQARIKTGRSGRWRVSFLGQNAGSWQLALALATDLSTYPSQVRRALLIEADPGSSEAVKELLKANQVSPQHSSQLVPGLTVGLPINPVSSRLVRGALLDTKGNLMVEPTLNLINHSNVSLVSGENRLRSNLWRPDQNLVDQLLTNINRFLNGERQLIVKKSKAAALLNGWARQLVWLGGLESQRLHAQVIGTIDRRFYRRVTTKKAIRT